MKNGIEVFKQFAQLTRLYALAPTLASCLVILSYAHSRDNFTILNFALLTFALCCVHLGANLFDDLIDVKLKLKQGYKLNEIHFDSIVPKAKLILNETFSFKKIYAILSILFSIALLVGIYFAITTDWKVLIFAFFGAILSLFYPISPKYYLGEVSIGLIYGPLMILGGYFALCGDIHPCLPLISTVIFLTTITLLHADNLMDYEHDIKESRKTICVLLKNKSLSILILKYIIILAYALITLGVLFKYLNPHTLYVYFTLPIAVKLIESMQDYIDIKNVEFKPRWYWGPFENWSEIEKNNIAFYMFRFLLARNYLFFFALFLSIGTSI